MFSRRKKLDRTDCDCIPREQASCTLVYRHVSNVGTYNNRPRCDTVVAVALKLTFAARARAGNGTRTERRRHSSCTRAAPCQICHRHGKKSTPRYQQSVRMPGISWCQCSVACCVVHYLPAIRAAYGMVAAFPLQSILFSCALDAGCRLWLCYLSCFQSELLYEGTRSSSRIRSFQLLLSEAFLSDQDVTLYVTSAPSPFEHAQCTPALQRV